MFSAFCLGPATSGYEMNFHKLLFILFILVISYISTFLNTSQHFRRRNTVTLEPLFADVSSIIDKSTYVKIKMPITSC